MTYCFPNATGGGFACFTVTARPFALLVLNNQSPNIGGSSGLLWCPPKEPVARSTLAHIGAKGDAPKATWLKSISGPI